MGGRVGVGGEIRRWEGLRGEDRWGCPGVGKRSRIGQILRECGGRGGRRMGVDVLAWEGVAR